MDVRSPTPTSSKSTAGSELPTDKGRSGFPTAAVLILIVNLSKGPGLIFISAEYRQPLLKPKGAVSLWHPRERGWTIKISSAQKLCGTTESTTTDLLSGRCWGAGPCTEYESGLGMLWGLSGPCHGLARVVAMQSHLFHWANPIPMIILWKRGFLAKEGLVRAGTCFETPQPHFWGGSSSGCSMMKACSPPGRRTIFPLQFVSTGLDNALTPQCRFASKPPSRSSQRGGLTGVL